MSQIEERFKEYQFNENFQYTFTDSQGEEFKAKPDCILLDTRDNTHVYLELKEHELNTTGSMEASKKAFLRQSKHRGISVTPDATHSELSSLFWNYGYRTDCLKHGWNHSVQKHAAVAKELAANDIRYIVVFSTHQPYRGGGRRKKHFKVYYQSYGIKEVMLESEVWELIESGVLVKVAIH